MNKCKAKAATIGILLIAAVLLGGCHSKSKNASAANPTTTTAGVSSSASGATGCQQVGSVHFDKSKFVLHAGLAFGAFHHFIYKPFKQGQLHGILKLGKAGLAGLFTVHELKLAKADAESSPTLCHLVAPFDKASAAISAEVSKLKHGKVTSQDVQGMNADVNSVQSGASSDGTAAPDITPSTAQLATH